MDAVLDTSSNAETGVPAGAELLAFVDAIAYLGTDDSGIQILNVANPAIPILIGAHPIDGTVYDLHIRYTLLLAAVGLSGLAILDISHFHRYKYRAHFLYLYRQ